MNRPYLARINAMFVLGVVVSGWMALTVAELDPPVLTTAIDEAMTGMEGREESPNAYEIRNHQGGSLLVRSYRHNPQAPGDPIRLLLVGTGSDRHIHHPPEYAYLAQGLDVLEDDGAGWPLPGAGEPIRIVAAPSQDSDKGVLALCWFTDGHRVEGNYRSRVLWDVWDRIRGMPRPWVMVRLEMPIQRGDSSQARLSAQKAEAALIPIASTVQRQLARMLP